MSVELEKMLNKLLEDSSADESVKNLLGKILMDKDGLAKAMAKSDFRKKVELGVNILKNNGYVDEETAALAIKHDGKEEDRFEFGEFFDAMTPNDVPMLMPRIVSQVVREAVEPIIALTGMLNEIRYSGPTIEFPSVGGMYAADVGMGQRYPAAELDFGGTIQASIGKSGLQVRFTDEVIRYSIFDVVGLHLRAAGRALARLKEVKVANLVLNLGTASFDNTGGTSVHGLTQGRDINAAGNNTMILDDIFTMYADLVNRGFIPNTFIVNPIGWLIFARHSTLRAWAFQNGAAMYQTAQGSPGFVGQKGVNLGPSGASGTTGRAINQTTTYADHPNQLFPANLGMVVTPFVTYNSTTNVTDIVLLDRTELGVLITDEPPTTDRWEDPSRDLQSIKIRERYGLGINNEGEGIALARSISTVKGFDFESLATFPIGTGMLNAIT